jgi:hypothetical protein
VLSRQLITVVAPNGGFECTVFAMLVSDCNGIHCDLRHAYHLGSSPPSLSPPLLALPSTAS